MPLLVRDLAAVLSTRISKLVGAALGVCTSLDFDFVLVTNEWRVDWKCCTCGAEVHEAVTVTRALGDAAGYEPPDPILFPSDADRIASDIRHAREACKLIADHIYRAVKARAHDCKELHE